MNTEKYRDRKITVFPLSEHVPLNCVVSDDWRNLVREEEQGGAINRISYEWCVLTALREKVRCKEVWVKGAHRLRYKEIRRLGSEFDYRVACALRRAGRNDLLARGEELGLHLLAAQSMLVVRGCRHDRRGAAPRH
jgi:hypothetical protein